MIIRACFIIRAYKIISLSHAVIYLNIPILNCWITRLLSMGISFKGGEWQDGDKDDRGTPWSAKERWKNWGEKKITKRHMKYVFKYFKSSMRNETFNLFNIFFSFFFQYFLPQKPSPISDNCRKKSIVQLKEEFFNHWG